MAESVYLENTSLLNELQQRKGLIPVGIDTEKQQLTWTDLGLYHCYEGFFRKSIQVYSSLKTDITSFTTQLDILEDDRIAGDYIYPTGFIFHAGHCGSTALAKSLARSRENLVLSEPAPLSQILTVFDADGGQAASKNKHIYRNLVLAMCRRRVPTHRHAFIKFTSHNIHYFELIHSAFPDVPAIFLSRDAPGIVASFRRQPPGWLRDGMDLEEKIKEFLAKANSISSRALKHIDHAAVTAENLSMILNYFKVNPHETALDLMKSQFTYDAKVEFNRKKFVK
ncbi:MAG: hypothetical protein ACXVJD_05405 [Mucilaginibacter sp.]